LKAAKNTVIFTGGSYGAPDFYRAVLKARPADQIIAADKGAEMARRLGLVPDVLVGDFDSADPAVIRAFVDRGVPVERHPVRKNQTDTELAVSVALSGGAASVILFGATGSRLDHVIGSINTLLGIEAAGAVGWLVDPHNRLRLLTGPGRWALALAPGTTVSLIPWCGPAGPVSLAGFDYPLREAMLTPETAGRTLSNVAAEREQCIAIGRGRVLLDIVSE
jgi:thiamine pyrophosphokinase